jgi:hypothetical protein
LYSLQRLWLSLRYSWRLETSCKDGVHVEHFLEVWAVVWKTQVPQNDATAYYLLVRTRLGQVAGLEMQLLNDKIASNRRRGERHFDFVVVGG